MKNVIVLLLTFLSFQLVAQDKSIGPTIGYNHAWGTGTGVESRPGFNAGVIFNYSFNEHWGLGASLLYSLEGAKVKGIDQTLDLSYVRIPLRAIYYFGDYGNAFRPKIFLGPSLGFLVGAKQKIGSTNIDLKDNFQSFDLGLLVGAGFNYRLKDQTWLNVDLGYTNGLLNTSTLNSVESQNRLFNLNIGVAFGLNK